MIVKKVLIWTLIFNFFLYLMITQYTKRYLDSQGDMLNVKWNLSTSYKSYILIFEFLVFTFLYNPLLYYIYFYIINKSYFKLASFVFICWIFWDFYPLSMTNNGYKIKNILMNLFDSIYAGPLWILISIYFYNNYNQIIEKSNTILFILLLLNIFIMLLFFYNGYIYNRKHTENNWLVKLGDKLNFNKLLNFITF